MTRRWRLFPKYALLILLLVGSMLVASGAIGLYASWRESRDHLVELQDEQAQNAAIRIAHFLDDIDHQLGWTTLPHVDGDGDAIEQRRIDYLKLLRQVPAITEVAWLDPQGKEQLRISRLAMDATGSGIDLSQQPAFRKGVSAPYDSPVYFRKGSEPYMTIALPAGSGGGVTAAEVNLKFVWDVVRDIRVGKSGIAYVVDADGILIAHPDISLVLKKTDMGALPQVAAARAQRGSAEPSSRAVDERNLAGEPVLSAHAPVGNEALGWTVFVESPRSEALAPLYATLGRSLALLVVAMLISIAASFFLARALVRPLRALQQGASRIGEGDLDRRIEVRTGDELEGLAEEFNRMGARLRESYAELERKVEQRTADLTAALDQQTATAEVLRVISGSVADSAPVFEKILESCGQLFASDEQGILLLGDDARIHLAAHRGDTRERLTPFFPAAHSPTVEPVVLSRSILHFRDVLNDAGVPAQIREIAGQLGIGTYSQVFAPMVWRGDAIGTLYVIRQPATGFSDQEIELLGTFADQAVIAIQNARLFNDTAEALEQQRASAEVLKAISSSVADTRPVFESILKSCERLFDATHVAIDRLGDDRVWHLAAYAGPRGEEIARLYPAPIAARDDSDEQLVRREVTHYADIATAPDISVNVRRGCEIAGCKSLMLAPMVMDDRRVGTILVGRGTGEPFSAKEQALLSTFADQAVIAIQNARLFNETKEALDQQTATAEVLQVISSSVADTQPVFDKILDSCERLFAANALGIYLVDDEGMLRMGGFRGDSLAPRGTIAAVAGTFPRPAAGTSVGMAIGEGRVVHFADVLADPNAPGPLRKIAEATGNASVAFAPMLWEGRGVGAIQVARQPPAAFSAKELSLLKTFADQAVIAIQNARLFGEIQAKSRELEAANRHKSEFLANMSHELRTPLNAIIGFSEVLSEQMFGEVNDKQLEYLRDIHSSGHHLLSLINDILDLSKIEAGRMELDLASTNLPMLLDNCTTLVRERASRNGLVLALDIQPGVGDWVADVRKLKQIVINLLSNAVKFTPAGGRVTLSARRLEHAVEIAVADTGVGIAQDQQALVFEEFRQAGGDYLRKSEGTGLGLALAKRFVELHGGTIRVESAPGRGATFVFVLPERVLEAL